MELKNGNYSFCAGLGAYACAVSILTIIVLMPVPVLK